MQTFIDSLGNWVTLTLGAITGATISAIVATNINKTNRKNRNIERRCQRENKASGI